MELFSPGHIVVIAIVAAVLFFGWNELPDIARSLGRSLRIFKTEITGMSNDDEAVKDARDAGTAPEADRPDPGAPAERLVRSEHQPTPPRQAQVVPNRPLPRPQISNQV